MDLDFIVNIALITSAVIVALRNIYGFLVGPKRAYSSYQKKHREETADLIRQIILEETKCLQLGFIDQAEVLKLILATQIERIYWMGFKDKVIYLYNLETLSLLYDFYKKLGGNGYIERLMEQMEHWTVISNP